MAIGDDAAAAGYPLVPNTGEGGQVRYGAREINRTRDFIAELEHRFVYSIYDPVGGEDGDFWFKMI